jgi:hypothetical protein
MYKEQYVSNKSQLKRTARIEEMQRYKKKWGMDQYKFFVYPHESHIIATLRDSYPFAFEIVSLVTLMKRVKRGLGVIVTDGPNGKMKFENFDQFKEFSLIEKLGLRNYE